MPFENEQITYYLEKAIDLLVLFGGRLILAALTIWIGLKIVRIITNGTNTLFKKQRIEKSLRLFLQSLISMGLKAIVFIIAATVLGVEMTSFIAMLGAMGLAVGLALQGSLSNFAGGVLILLLKPFKVGDFIEAGGFLGTVDKIDIFSTAINTPDNKKIHIPNAILSNGAIQNFSQEKFRRVDFTVGIGYDDDIQKAKDTLLELAKKDQRILSEPAVPFVGVSELADSSVNLAFRVWVEGKDYWDVFFDLNEKIKTTFDEKSISIPFPQRDIHLIKSE
ncbi:mechanosensitive ion channel protein MscS [bacterium DOLZORAL124_38_8]|nr:MAG: mechanosensitive ion channel protein MscS [bacterium DOLZORAL124_38_8]